MVSLGRLDEIESRLDEVECDIRTLVGGPSIIAPVCLRFGTLMVSPTTEQPIEPKPVALTGRAGAQPVVLVDRIAWQWYLVTAVIPIVGALIGLIAGIVFMAKSKIGPALALWATAWLAALVWGTLALLVPSGWAFDQARSHIADRPAITESFDSGDDKRCGTQRRCGTR